MTEEKTVQVWDIGVRLFHWSLVAFYSVAYISGEEEGFIHAYAGYAIISLLLFRVTWGIVGTRHARFTDFIFGPQAVLRYAKSMLARRPLHYLGHNPLGGWMVLALLISLSIASWTGLEAYAMEGKGPLATNFQINVISPVSADGHDEKENGEDNLWKELHEVFAHLTLILVVIHVLGVVSASLLHHENLIRAMVTGDKTINSPPGN
jgi:cytochrome b